MIRKYIFILWLLSGFMIGQSNGVRFYKLTMDDGLSESSVRKIYKDKTGFWWFATFNGLNRWNGQNFDSYFNVKGDTNSLGEGYVNDIFEDRKGQLWLGTDQGALCKYNPMQDNFSRYSIPYFNFQNSIIVIESFGKDLIVSAKYNGILLFDLEKEKYKQVFIKTDDGYRTQNISVYDMMWDQDSSLWVAHLEGLLKIDQPFKNMNIDTLYAKNMGMIEGVRALHCDKWGKVWAGTFDDGIYTFNRPYTNFEKIEYGLKNNKNTNSAIITGFAEHVNGDLWVSTYEGINIYNYRTKTFSYVLPDYSDIYALGTKFIHTIYSDEDKNIWLGTYNDGVVYTNQNKNKFNHIRSFGHKNDLNNNFILCMEEAGDHKIWLGTNGGGINIFDAASKNIEQLTIPSFAKSPDQPNISIIRDLCFDQNEIMYVATNNNGLFAYNTKTKKIKNYRSGHSQNDLHSNIIWDVEMGKNNESIWVGTFGYGLYQFDLKKETFRHMNKTGKDAIKGTQIHQILRDSKENIWVTSHSYGLSRLVNEELGIFKNPVGKHPKLADPYIKVMHEDIHGNLWLGTTKGSIYLLRNDSIFIEEYKLFENTKNAEIRTIESDEFGKLWVTSVFGLHQMIFNEDSLALVRHFSKSDGLQSNVFNTNSSLWASDNRIYLGGLNGFNYFRSHEIEGNTGIGNVVIHNIKVNNEDILKEAYILDRNQQKIKLQSHQSSISFDFIILDYKNTDRNAYKYRLVNYDNEWTYAGPTHNATYMNLEPGSYEFEVIGIDGMGKESNNVASVAFKVLPPFHKTIWFYLLVGITIIMIFIIIYRVRVKALQINKNHLAQLVNERTRKLKALNAVLEEQSDELKFAHNQIKDSIQYAKRIQLAILPPKSVFNRNFENGFVLYRPKDVVSGDFYWTKEVGDTLLFAVADCTGHGVPGALVSMICTSVLNQCIREFGLTEPSEILNKTRNLVIKRFSNNEVTLNDGMDISLCAINKKTNELQWAGANSYLYIVKKRKGGFDASFTRDASHYIHELRGNNQPIGQYAIYKPFTNYTHQLESGDAIYAFTDGYADQFGGPNDKKFKKKKLKELILEIFPLSPKEQKLKMIKIHEEWKGDREQTDDICVAGLTIK